MYSWSFSRRPWRPAADKAIEREIGRPRFAGGAGRGHDPGDVRGSVRPVNRQGGYHAPGHRGEAKPLVEHQEGRPERPRLGAAALRAEKRRKRFRERKRIVIRSGRGWSGPRPCLFTKEVHVMTYTSGCCCSDHAGAGATGHQCVSPYAAALTWSGGIHQGFGRGHEHGQPYISGDSEGSYRRAPSARGPIPYWDDCYGATDPAFNQKTMSE